MALLLAFAAAAHPIVRERRWLMPALLFSAAGDWLLAIPWWALSFVLGLAAFLLAHLCFLGALLPLARQSDGRGPAGSRVGLMCAACVALLVWFWPQLGRDGLTIPVTVYIVVLAAMACAALLARLPTLDGGRRGVLRGVGRDDRHRPVHPGQRGAGGTDLVAYAAAQILITAGFFFGRRPRVDAGYGLCYTWRVTVTLAGNVFVARGRCDATLRSPSRWNRSPGCCRCCRCRTWTASSTTWCRRSNPTTPSPGCGCGCVSTAGWSTGSSWSAAPRPITSASWAGWIAWCPPSRCSRRRSVGWSTPSPRATPAPAPTCCGWRSRPGTPRSERKTDGVRQSFPLSPPVDPAGWEAMAAAGSS